MIISAKRGDSIPIDSRKAPGVIQFRPDESYGATLKLKVKTTNVDLATGTTTAYLVDWIPDGAIVLALVGRITTTITCGTQTTLTCTDGSSIIWFTKAGKVAGTTFTQADGATQVAPKIFAALDSLTFTISGGSGNMSTGVLRLVMYYFELAAPTW
jgi:hypothetical protein